MTRQGCPNHGDKVGMLPTMTNDDYKAGAALSDDDEIGMPHVSGNLYLNQFYFGF